MTIAKAKYHLIQALKVVVLKVIYSMLICWITDTTLQNSYLEFLQSFENNLILVNFNDIQEPRLEKKFTQH